MARSDSLALFDRFETSIRNGSFKPVYLLYGKEKYLIDRCQKLVVEHALAPHERDFNLTIVYGGDVESQSVLAECASYPTMAQRRVVIVRDFDELAGNDQFMAYAKQPNPQTILVLVSGAGIKSNPYAAISRAAETFNMESVLQNRVPGWIRNALGDLGYKISASAIEMLAELAGSDLYTISNEIDKLVSFVGDRKSVEEKDVLEVAGHSSEFNVFELQKRVVAADFLNAEAIMSRMLQVSSNTAGTAIMTVTVLASYFTKLMKLSDQKVKALEPNAVAKLIGVPSYFVSEYRSALKSVGDAGIERANLALLGADYELKGGSERDEWLILTMMLRRLTGGKDRNIGRAAA